MSWPQPGKSEQSEVSHHTPLAPQQPLAATDQNHEQKENRHVPDVQIVMARDAGLGNGYFARHFLRVARSVIVAPGIARQFFQKVAVLGGAEVLRHAILAPECKRVAPEIGFVLTRARFGDIGSWF